MTRGRPPRLSVAQKLDRFSPEWQRSVHAGLSNDEVRDLVAAGWLERRLRSMSVFRGGNVLVAEYRLSDAGRARLLEVQT